MNKVILSGNLTRDVEVRYTQSGKAYARAGIAVNRPFSKNKEVDFFNLVIWDKLAEICGKYLPKGSKVLVEGRLQTGSYEKNGTKFNTFDIVVEGVDFADGRKKSAPSPDDFEGEPIDDSDTPF